MGIYTNPTRCGSAVLRGAVLAAGAVIGTAGIGGGGLADASGAEAKSRCNRIVAATPGHWTEDSGCDWSTPRGKGPFRVTFSWDIAPSGTNQTACVQAKADANGPWHSAGCGKRGAIGLPAPGNSIGAYRIRVKSMQPFSIAQVRWGGA
ncbi:hypothetical protein [Actinomadura terrae]|uniref:hypothetical protein n=1 Tax=Actinomadura terrae TaxID=604353 RepID=UPI001FA773CA|nr:hypothetical protein [Actinomadura terrae]